MEDGAEDTEKPGKSDDIVEDEDETSIEEHRTIGSGVNLDIENDAPDAVPDAPTDDTEESDMSPIEDAAADDVTDEHIDGVTGEDTDGPTGEDTDGATVEDIEDDTGEDIDEQKPPLTGVTRREGEFVTTCGSGGMLVVSPSADTWPQELSLYVLRGMYNAPLPEHAECLAVDALLRMCKLDFELEERDNVEYMSPSGRAPFMKCGPLLVSEMDPIVRHLYLKGMSLSGDLSDEESLRQRELSSLIRGPLSAAEVRACWLHTKTRRALTERHVVGHYPWPLSSIIGRQKRNRALAWLSAQDTAGGVTSGEPQSPLDQVYTQVDQVCNALSLELGDAPYFFGEKPTELEALLYGHIFLLLTIPVPVGEQTSISKVIQEYPNLVSLVEKMASEIYGRDLQDLMAS